MIDSGYKNNRKQLHLLGNKNIFEPKKLRYLQRISKIIDHNNLQICNRITTQPVVRSGCIFI